MGRTEYADRTILALRTKYEVDQTEDRSAETEIGVGIRKLSLRRESLFEGKCSILLPETMTDMGDAERTVIYRNLKRPQIIKTDREAGVAMTFSLLPVDDMPESISMQLDRVCCDMKKIWKQNVFYDKGEIQAEGVSVAWMDYRAFCLDSSLYCLLFMFLMEEQIVLGNFHCSFPQYDIWKPTVLKLLATLQVHAELNI